MKITIKIKSKAQKSEYTKYMCYTSTVSCGEIKDKTLETPIYFSLKNGNL